MTATQAWGITVALALGALFVSFLLGWNFAAEIGSGLHGLEHWLGSPLVLLRSVVP
jgi:hypothetical protein